MKISRAINPSNCAVRERTADGVSVGRCMHALRPGDYCPRHKDVSVGMEFFRDTGHLFEDPRECICGLKGYATGDDCQYCNPRMAQEIKAENRMEKGSCQKS